MTDTPDKPAATIPQYVWLEFDPNLHAWCEGKPHGENCHHYTATCSLPAQNPAVEALRALEEIREIYAGSEIGEPVTAQEAYVVQEIKRMYQVAVDTIKALRSMPDQKAVEVDRTQAMEATLKECGEALEMMYSKWENGVTCYEDPEDRSGHLGNAFSFEENEEDLVLGAIENVRGLLASGKGINE